MAGSYFGGGGGFGGFGGFGGGMGGYTPGMNMGQMPTNLFGNANFGIPQQMGSFSMPMFQNANFGIGGR
jgi:hypothetical protein